MGFRLSEFMFVVSVRIDDVLSGCGGACVKAVAEVCREVIVSEMFVIVAEVDGLPVGAEDEVASERG